MIDVCSKCGQPHDPNVRRGIADPTLCYDCRQQRANELSKQRPRHHVNPQATSRWTKYPILDDRLTEWVSDGISYSVIAEKFQLMPEGVGLTKNACLSRATRLGIKRRLPDGKPGSVVRARKPKPPRVERVPKAPRPVRDPNGPLPSTPFRERRDPNGAPEMPGDTSFLARVAARDAADPVPEGERRKLADLKENQCKWVYGDPQTADYHFCHLDRLSGKPYCHKHTLRAENPEKPARPYYGGFTVIDGGGETSEPIVPALEIVK